MIVRKKNDAGVSCFRGFSVRIGRGWRTETTTLGKSNNPKVLSLSKQLLVTWDMCR